MYEENENKLDWTNILKKLGIAVGAIVVILLVVTGITKCAKSDDKKPSEKTPVDLTSQLDQLESATLSYLTKDNLPVEINASKTIRLKILINKDLITEIKDSDNNRCDINESYSEVTRLENSYAVKMSLSCGQNKDYRIIYVGCFEECNGGICKGTENSVNGICNVVPTNPEPNPENPSNPSTSTTTKPNTTTTTKKPGTTTKKATTTTKKTTTTTPKEVWYEYKKCTTTPAYCPVGSPKNGRCERLVPYTEYGTVVNNPTTTTTPIAAKKVLASTTTVYFKRVSEAPTKTDLVEYVYLGYFPKENSSNPYKFTKKTYKYQCTEGNPSSDGKTCYVTTTTSGTPSCADPRFTYHDGVCTRMNYKAEYSNMVPAKESCETTWSKSTYLPGWTRTGRTK